MCCDCAAKILLASFMGLYEGFSDTTESVQLKSKLIQL